MDRPEAASGVTTTRGIALMWLALGWLDGALTGAVLAEIRPKNGLDVLGQHVEA